ncbi:MAG: hypothetical protein J4428_00865 [Candidatus Aenigmarchaeota archaeon]|nr:hypothetical protein [Candidatus Aenigmarchaeota archaeon]
MVTIYDHGNNTYSTRRNTGFITIAGLIVDEDVYKKYLAYKNRRSGDSVGCSSGSRGAIIATIESNGAAYKKVDD